jgi:type II secretory pathway pseudopilin PulG
MAETIWSVIAVIGGLALIVFLLWSLATGRDDRDKEEAARRYFDEHGHWPDESPN